MIEYVIKININDEDDPVPGPQRIDNERHIETYVRDSIWPTLFALYGNQAEIMLVRNSPNPTEILEHLSK